MRLRSLSLTNFRQHRETEILFREGLTAVLGPNGSGKTTLLESVAWALYGSPALRGVNQDLRCLTARPRTPVRAVLEFTLGGELFRVDRRTDGASLFRGDSAGAESIGTSEVTFHVRRLLGMDHREFFASFFTGQKELPVLGDVDGQKRAAAVARMLGLDRLSAARDLADDKRKGLRHQIDAIQKGLSDPEAIAREVAEAGQREAEARAALEEARRQEQIAVATRDALAPQAEASVRRKEQHDAWVQERGRVELQLDSATGQLRVLEERRKALQAGRQRRVALQPLLDEFEALKTEHGPLAELQKFEKERSELAGRRIALCTELEKLDAKALDLAPQAANAGVLAADLQAGRSALESVQSEQETAKAKWMQERSDAQAKERLMKVRQVELQEHRRAVVEAGEIGICPVCERSLGTEFAVVVAHFDTESATLAEGLALLKTEGSRLSSPPARLSALEQEMKQRGKEIEAAQMRLAEAQAAIRGLTAANNEATACRRKIDAIDARLQALPSGFDAGRWEWLMKRGKELEAPRDEANRIDGELNQLPELEAGIAEQSMSRDTHQSRAGELAAHLQELSFSQEDHVRLTTEAANAVVAAGAATTKRLVKEAEIKSAAAALAAANEKDAEYRKWAQALEERREEHRYAETAGKWLGDLRDVLNQRVRPELEAIGSELLASLTDGRYTELRLGDGFVPRLVQDGAEKGVISGGEEDVANLCLRLAISRLITERAGHPLSLLILDEVFASLDVVRRDNLARLLQGLKSQFEQIIMITHVESIHDTADHCLWIHYDEGEGVSSVSEAGYAGLELDPLETSDLGV